MRKQLKQMTPEERREWAEQTHAALNGFSAYVQQYLDRRKNNQSRGKGTRTRTDENYEQFQILCADILRALAEIQEESAQDEGEQV